jgi:hypothetical protein
VSELERLMRAVPDGAMKAFLRERVERGEAALVESQVREWIAMGDDARATIVAFFERGGKHAIEQAADAIVGGSDGELSRAAGRLARSIEQAARSTADGAPSPLELRAMVGGIPTWTTSDPCPHPARRGEHELYLTRGRAHCRACGALDEAPATGPKVPDGCEWNPRLDAPAIETDAHHRSAPADLIVGADGRWRLCAACAKLPAFARLKVRRPVRRSAP